MKTNFKAVAVWLVLTVSGSLCAGEVDMGSPTQHTPYDAYMAPVWTVFGHLGNNQPDLPSVQSLVRQGHDFKYVFKSTQPYLPQTPEETESTKSGDCKAKSLWLAYKMDSRKVRFVVGKARLVSTISHAWLIWESPSGWLILDATNFNQPLMPARLSSSEFIPLYSYSPSGKFIHSAPGGTRGSKYGDHL